MNFIFFARAFRATGTVTPEAAGQLGEFVGGYGGPFIALIGVLLLVATLRSQQTSSQLAAFEAKYFELIKMHRDNVAELQVQGVVGRKLFVWLTREFRGILGHVKLVAARTSQELTPNQFIHITYYCLLYGTGPNSSRMLKQSLNEFNGHFVDELEKELQASKKSDQKARNFPYKPYEGHLSRLSHYDRHLYQSVHYVDSRTIDIDKDDYVKTIVAQLTTHEQALLLLHSLSPLGKEWWDKEFLIKYHMVQNIPRDFFDLKEIDLSTLGFPRDYFEWEQIDRADVAV